MEHTPLPECIDRLARIETNLENLTENHLTSIYDSLKELRADVKSTNHFVITQFIIIGLGVATILIRALFIG